jgi:Na+-translocating ferredoxin:NAD+ oxidoreductase subunit A
MSWIGLILTFSLVQNVVLVQLLGICPCVGAPRSLKTAVGIGLAVTVMMSLASLAAWALGTLVLAPLKLEWLQTIAFVLATGAVAWLFESVAGRAAPGLLRATGFSAAGVAVNCAVLGVALQAARGPALADGRQGPLVSLAAGFAAGCGMLLVLVLLSAIRERLDAERVPKLLKGLPISLVSAGLLALGFTAFDRALLARLLPLLGLPQ